MQLCDAFDLPDHHACRHAGDDGRPGDRGDGAGAPLLAPVRDRRQRHRAGRHDRPAQVLRPRRPGDGRRAAPRRRWPASRGRPASSAAMGLEGAVRLGYRRELDAIDDPAARDVEFQKMVERMYQHGKALNTASHFEIDDVIDPADTRRWMLAVLGRRRRRRHAPARSARTSTPGRRASMHVDEVELRVVRLPYRSVFKTSFAAESEKHAVIATVRSDGRRGLRRGRDGRPAGVPRGVDDRRAPPASRGVGAGPARATDATTR